MKTKHLFILFLALFATSVAQSDDELQIPVENDNQFPPDNQSELEGIAVEGSGAGVIEEPLEATTKLSESQAPLLEDVQLSSTFINTEIVTNASEYSCPTSCVCNIEGNSNKYNVDCSNSDLTELPSPLDPKTTSLNLQNNKLNGIPKEISTLKNLQILNVNNNEIMDLAAGSISELPELISLKLGNNRLIEYPTDLKNGFGLIKLEELDLGGNDMRTVLKSETFSHFKALKKLTLPSAAADIVDDVCTALKESLVTVCTGSCSDKSFDCDAPHSVMEEDFLSFALPGLLAFGTAAEDDIDPTVNLGVNEIAETQNQEKSQTTAAPNLQPASSPGPVNPISFRSAKAGEEEPKSEVEPKQTEETSHSDANQKTNKAEGEVVGATTSSTNTGGVDKGIIGLIVAGMVLVVAGIAIKKNWSSIKNRFSSSPRSANERTGTTGVNGTAPEEVPLQEKSPV